MDIYRGSESFYFKTNWLLSSEAYLEPLQVSNMRLFMKIVNVLKSLPCFRKLQHRYLQGFWIRLSSWLLSIWNLSAHCYQVLRITKYEFTQGTSSKSRNSWRLKFKIRALVNLLIWFADCSRSMRYIPRNCLL